MDRSFPLEMMKLLESPTIRKAFVSEIVSPNPNDCTNCGGVGTIYVFIATIGPLQSPAVGKNIISHWSDGKWWGGKGIEFDCPVCHSLASPYREIETVWQRDKRVSEQLALLTEGWAVKDV